MNYDKENLRKYWKINAKIIENKLKEKKTVTEEERIVDNLEDLKTGIPYLSTMIIKK